MAGDNVIPVDTAQLDASIVASYLNNEWLLDTIMKWVWVPDDSQLPDLIKAKQVIDAIQPTKLPPNLYRGMSSFVRPSEMRQQDTLGLLKRHGDKYVLTAKTLITINRPTAFTESFKVAYGFSNPGGVSEPGWVLTISTTGLTNSALVISDELMAAIAKYAKIRGKLHSQKEVIILPTKTPVSILAITSKKPQSSKW